MRSVRAIENADVCLLVIDATQNFESQDLNIFTLAARNNKGVVILVNKWDLVEKGTHSTKEYEARIREKTAPFQDIPIIFTSALTKQRVYKAVETALEVCQNRVRKSAPRSLMTSCCLSSLPLLPLR
jgi:GTPase